MSKITSTLFVLGLWILVHPVQSAFAYFVNFESPQVHPIALSPDGQTLAVCNTADDRVQIYTVQGDGGLQAGAAIRVGIDPVSVRFRSNNELWAVNLISDSVSIVDLSRQMVVHSLQTLDEPCDVVFAGSPERAYVSCSSVNTIQVFETDGGRGEVGRISIEGEDPRALAVSPDGRHVYTAVFESGNGTTILMGGFEGATAGSAENGGAASFMPNVVGLTIGDWWQGPYGGQNPPPNQGAGFAPPLNPNNPPAPPVGHIVKYHAPDGSWLDDNGGDWTRLVSGDVSPYVGRRSDWELVDNDIAIVDTTDHSVSYVERLMHLCMALDVNPATGELLLVGTDATNEIRFEPNLKGTFVRSMSAMVDPATPTSPQVVDLNPHLSYTMATVDQATRDLSIGEPRGVAWRADGAEAYVVGRGSNNLLVLDREGTRIGRVEVGEGPTGVVASHSAERIYVLNQFDASISIVDTGSQTEVDRVSFFDPTPAAIKQGRKFLYDTHLTSGLGQASCASCHVDTRMDRLVWDLGDPAGDMVGLDRNDDPDTLTMNLGGGIDGPPDDFTDFHPMKGPMKTQTLQDIIGKEPLHWRGDRAGIEHFNGAYISLNGDDETLTTEEMQQLKAYLATIHFPPNPYRNIDNSLPTHVALDDFYGGGRFDDKGVALPPGNAQRGLDELFRPFDRGICGGQTSCVTCHSLPSGVGMNATYDRRTNTYEPIPIGADGNAHHLLIQTDGSVQKTFKASQLRNLYDQTGYDLTQQRSLSGFGIQHDGAIPNLAVYFESLAFTPDDTQDVADLVALMLAFSGGDFGAPVDDNEPPSTTPSKDAHAAVGQQVTITTPAGDSRLDQLLSVAATGQVDLVAICGQQGWSFEAGSFQPDRAAAEKVSKGELLNLASDELPITFLALPSGVGQRYALDRDSDGLYDGDERADLSSVAGFQNPFSSDIADSTGDDGSATPDGIADGLNDFDGDGISNADELKAGTNPVENMAAEFDIQLRITISQQGYPQIVWRGDSRTVYQVQESIDLLDWQAASSGRFETGDTEQMLSWTSPSLAGDRGYYRVVVLGAP